jgi:protoheme IX farnesyltransferase
MQTTVTYSYSFFSIIREKLKVYAQLSKVRLSLLVVFSAVMAFLYEQVPYTWIEIVLLSLGGFLVTSASNTINQIIEKDTDKLMTRTENRPLPSGNISVLEATIFAGFTGVAGIAILGIYFNTLSGLLGSLSLLSYAFIYTPFKKLSPASVFVGAIPGSMPLLIGATAAAGQITSGGIILFVIQFLWQIPHFWSIAWLLNSDYEKGGFYLLPSAKGKSREAALQNIPYLIMLLFVSFAPFIIGQVGIYALVAAFVAGMYFLYRGIQLAIDLSDRSAKQLMFASFIYIPVVQLAFVFDKI